MFTQPLEEEIQDFFRRTEGLKTIEDVIMTLGRPDAEYGPITHDPAKKAIARDIMTQRYADRPGKTSIVIGLMASVIIPLVLLVNAYFVDAMSVSAPSSREHHTPTAWGPMLTGPIVLWLVLVFRYFLPRLKQ